MSYDAKISKLADDVVSLRERVSRMETGAGTMIDDLKDQEARLRAAEIALAKIIVIATAASATASIIIGVVAQYLTR